MNARCDAGETFLRVSVLTRPVTIGADADGVIELRTNLTSVGTPLVWSMLYSPTRKYRTVEVIFGVCRYQ